MAAGSGGARFRCRFRRRLGSGYFFQKLGFLCSFVIELGFQLVDLFRKRLLCNAGRYILFPGHPGRLHDTDDREQHAPHQHASGQFRRSDVAATIPFWVFAASRFRIGRTLAGGAACAGVPPVGRQRLPGRPCDCPAVVETVGACRLAVSHLCPRSVRD